MRYLVAGGSGFLGSHLCKKLLNDNHEVVCVDNNLTSKKKNLDILKNQKFKYFNRDITKNFKLKDIGKYDGIFNFACPASPIKYQIDPIYTSKISYIGTLNLLEMAKKNNSKFLLASTSEIYGDPLVHPQTEDYNGNVNTFGPRACYDEGKRIAETLCYDFFKKFNVQVRIPRIFNTFGPNMEITDGRVISNFIISCLKNEDIQINGDGTQTRSFCYVDDLIEGVVKLFNKNRKELSNPINLGNPAETKIIDLCYLIKDLTNSKSKLCFNPLPLNDPLKRKPNIDRAKKYLNWQPKCSLKEGLIRTIGYFENLLSNKHQ